MQPLITITVAGDLHIHPQANPQEIIQPILAAIAEAEGNIMTDFHAEMGALLDQVVAAVDTLDTDLARELADFASALSPKLTQEEKDRFAALTQRLVDFNANIDAVDPPVVP
jgi:hypothetical protein